VGRDAKAPERKRRSCRLPKFRLATDERRAAGPVRQRRSQSDADDLDGELVGNHTAHVYLPARCDSTGGSCFDIAVATAKATGLASADVGSKLYALVTATNAAGSASTRTYLSVIVQPQHETV
jgi:hypothetical protein